MHLGDGSRLVIAVGEEGLVQALDVLEWPASGPPSSSTAAASVATDRTRASMSIGSMVMADRSSSEQISRTSS